MSEMIRLLGYVYEQGDCFTRPVWLCPQEIWKEAEELGYLENGATKPFIPRQGTYFQASRLTALGKQKFWEMLPKASQ